MNNISTYTEVGMMQEGKEDSLILVKVVTPCPLGFNKTNYNVKVNIDSGDGVVSVYLTQGKV